MKKEIDLEMRIKVPERMIRELVSGNPLITYPDESDVQRIRMEVFQEIKAAYPEESIDFPRS